MFPAVERVNHIEPSGAGAMSSGPPSTGNNCTAFVSCNHSGLHPKAALCTGPNAPRFAGRIGAGTLNRGVPQSGVRAAAISPDFGFAGTRQHRCLYFRGSGHVRHVHPVSRAHARLLRCNGTTPMRMQHPGGRNVSRFSRPRPFLWDSTRLNLGPARPSLCRCYMGLFSDNALCHGPMQTFTPS
jgi:hypothetical protein